MATELLTSKDEDFSGDELADFCNEESGHSYSDLGTAIVFLGLSVVSGYVLPGIAGAVASKIVFALRAIGVAKSLSAVISMIEDNGGVAARKAVISKIASQGGKMRVTTKYYEYTSGSGNSNTHYTTTTYTWVA